VIGVQTVNIAMYGQQIIEKQAANYTQVIKVFIQTDPCHQNVLIKSVEVTKIKKWWSIETGTPLTGRPSQVSSPKELPLQALPEPDVNLSTHPAPIVQSF